MNESLHFFLKTKRRTGEAKDYVERVQQKGWGGKMTRNKLRRAKRKQNGYLMKRSKRQLDYLGNII